MHLFRFTLLSIILAISGLAAFAQKGSVSGIVTDSKNALVSYATVTVLKADSSVAGGDMTKDDGSFTVANLSTGSFRLRIEFMGMLTKFVPFQITSDAPDKNLGTIKIASTQNKLDEVSIVGEKSVVELKVDKKVFNVDKNTTTAGGSAADVLQNVPSVSVGTDGTVSLRGKSDVTILIDGKPSTLLGSDVNSALQSISANSIESVEVITNPSAKYDAQGTGGIINIITKKDGRFGMNGNINLGAGTRDKYNGSLGLNAHKGKWNAFLNSSFRLNSTYNNVITNRYNKDSTPQTPSYLQSFHTYERVPRNFDGAFNSIGATYEPNKNNSITLTENINFMRFAFRDTSNYSVFNNPTQSGTPVYYQSRYSNFFVGPFSTSTSLDYKHKFKKKDHEISMDVSYATFTTSRQQDYITISDSNVGGTTTKLPVTNQHAPGHGANSTLTGWSDYTNPLFTKNGKLGLGFKSSIYTFTSGNNPTIDSNNGKGVLTDYALLSNFSYEQQIHAAYVNWSDQFGKFSYQAGVRVEDAIYNGNGQLANVTRRDTSFHNDFFNFFPSAFISYQLPAQQSIYLNYSRRTNRPNFRQLLPFVDVSNPGTINSGNPSLKPEFINNVEFSYNKNDKKGNNIILSAYYALTENLIQTVPIPISAADAEKYGVGTSQLFSSPNNIASGTTYGAEIISKLQPLPIWDATLNINLFENVLKAGNSIDPTYLKYLKSSNGFAWFGKLNTNLKLPKNFSFQVNANYESSKVIAQGSLKETWWIDLALKKNLWKNKATIILNCSDIFKTHNFITDYNLTSYAQTINRVKETRIGNITFTYRFGKSDMGKNGGNAKRKGTDEKGKPVKPNDEDRDKNLKDKDDNDQGAGGQPGGQGNGGGQKSGGGSQ